MNLLMITQKVDCSDPILGFFHRWIEEFAKHCENVTVIGQLVGRHILPQNVHVLSLKKEQGWPRFLQIVRFWFLIAYHARAYDTVLVHMTPVWVLLGYPWWFLTRKPVYLWYETRRGGFILRKALWCVKKVFCATPDGLPFSSKKTVVTGHGIDTGFFKPGNDQQEPGLIVAIGRITRIKRLDLIIETFAKLPSSYHLVIAGGVITQKDREEQEHLDELVQRLSIHDRVVFTGFLTQTDVRALVQKASLLLHAAGGGLDKVILEAMACGCPLVCASEAALRVLPSSCSADHDSVFAKAQHLLTLSDAERQALGSELRSRVLQGHALPTLIQRITKEME